MLGLGYELEGIYVICLNDLETDNVLFEYGSLACRGVWFFLTYLYELVRISLRSVMFTIASSDFILNLDPAFAMILNRSMAFMGIARPSRPDLGRDDEGEQVQVVSKCGYPCSVGFGTRNLRFPSKSC